MLCVPALAGLAAPWWNSDATAVLRGMSLATTRADLVTAVLQGLAAQVAELADLVASDLGQPLTRLRVDGGLTRSRVFMQTVADLDAAPDRRLPVGARHPARRGRAAAQGSRPVAAARRRRRRLGAGPLVRARPGADRAETFRDHWRRVVEMTQI